MTKPREFEVKERDPIHEAVCKAAGWKAYCERCGAKTVRVVNIAGSYSYCPNMECNEAIKEELRKTERYWEND